MSLEILNAKEALRNLIDQYASLGDEKKTAQQMLLFTPDAAYRVFLNGIEISSTIGRDTLGKEFAMHASQVKTYFTLNGQYSFFISEANASGVSFSQLKMVREKEGLDYITDYSVRYEDQFIFQDGKWLISSRTANFLIVETRPLEN